MKKYFSVAAFVLFLSVKSQSLYIDPVTTAAIFTYGSQLKSGQDKTNEEVSKLKQAQAFVSSQMVYANNIQDKILKGLREVSQTVSNGIRIKDIYEDISDSYKAINKIQQIVAQHPQYAVFGAKAAQRTYEQALKTEADAQRIITASDTNLMYAGDRSLLLNDISRNIKVLKVWLIQVKLDLQRAVRLGFWKSINPFQGYINTDMNIVKNIMSDYNTRF